mmetsp:Transcript_7028/g.21077  ORF Transcript_7028/g.21077 Transcript_7028/m.21077 type:complete len:285 (-) Transcript_7028:727-1581(-)
MKVANVAMGTVRPRSSAGGACCLCSSSGSTPLRPSRAPRSRRANRAWGPARASPESFFEGREGQNTLNKKQGGSGQPWHIKEYITKRKRRQTNALGNIVDDDEDFLDPAGWDEDAKMRLAVDCVARELGVSQEHVTRRLEVLQKLVPDLKPKLRAMKIGDLARLSVKCKTIPHDLIELKDIFPLANVSRMVAAKPSLLYEDMGDLRRRAERLRQVLGTSDVDRAVELNPTFLDLEQTELAIEEISRLMPREDPRAYLLRNPSMLYSTQARENIICYDGSSEHHD